MHPSILAKRKADAVNRIIQVARSMDPERAEALQPKGIKDPATAEMMRMEAIADLLEHLGTPAVSTETEPADDPRPTLDDLPDPVVEAPSEEEPAEELAPKKKSPRARKK